MHRNTAGALASLTATYTDSDVSEGEENDEEEEDEEAEGSVGIQIRPIPGIHTPTPNHSSSDALHHILTKVGEESGELRSSRATTPVEMPPGHITDEELSSPSDKDDDDEEQGTELNTPLNIKDMATSTDDIQIPPEPPGKCAVKLQEKFVQFYEKMLREGLDHTVYIQNQKNFRNPSIYEKLIQYCQIDELGTNYSPDIYDPSVFGPKSYYEELAKAQKAEMDKRQKEQKERTKVEFISGTAKKLTPGESDDSKKRKSKWDVGSSQGVSMSTLIKPSVVINPPGGIIPLTTTATGTKAKVISAFGTIAKKPKQ